jgi:hypothetical protein
MGRTLGSFVVLFLLLACSIAAVAQNATTQTQSAPPSTVIMITPSGNAPVTSGALPLPAPPSAALPGSGTPVGAPPDVNVNNAAQGGSGAIVQPGAVVVGGEAYVNQPPAVATPVSTPQNIPGPEATAGIETVPSASEATQPTTPMILGRTFAGSATVPAPAPAKSLGEVAAQMRGNKPLPKRTFDNSDITALNQQAPQGLRPQSEDLPQGDQPLTATPQQKGKKPSAAKPPQPQAGNGALDQNDLAAVEAAVKKSKEKQNAERPK